MAGDVQTTSGTEGGVSHVPGPDGGAEGAERPGRRSFPPGQRSHINDSKKHRGARRRAVMLAVAAGIALLAAGCGGGSTSAGSGASPGADKGPDKMIAYAQCIRSHGVPKFPDPSSNGQLSVNGNALGVSPAVLQAAMQACSKLAGGRQSGQSSAQNAAEALKFAQCLRTHGEPNFPDPSSDGTFDLGGTSINTQSSTFLAAEQACKSVEPPDLSMNDNTRVSS